ncbi:L,D-transpeptidase family protein [Hydrogenophaga crassostreae]|nr:L,D-transpeptidase family protein [Hydrogenophaga crassostreae]
MVMNTVLPELEDGTTSSGLVHRSLSSAALEQSLPLLGQAEARLIRIYQLISQAERHEALKEAESLVSDYPNFHLANLVLGDLLSVYTRPVRQLGDVPDTKAIAATEQLEVLREQSRRRLLALTERPPENSVPSQFLGLSTQSRHAIAVDASRSRLYLFENTRGDGKSTASQMKLVGDYYISVGQSGVDKTSEGDLRTPVGVYYITSSLDAAKLPDLYGSGALPINYPNALDLQRGKTGSGIWLHGSPSEQFARSPQASEGCVVLSNQDLETLLGKVKIRTTPVVIATELRWVAPEALTAERDKFEKTLEAWRTLKSQGNLDQLKTFYSSRFDNQGQKLAEWWPQIEGEVRTLGSRDLELKDLSVLNWRDKDDTMVVTFGEVPVGKTRGMTKRQYWMLEGNEWKIFNEGTV